MTELHYTDDAVTIYAGDCLDVLAELPDASVDSVVTDPPYGLDFMGKHWDTGAVAFDTAVWGHCLRVLKPGGHLLAFGGTRTWHRLACAVEDAGFEIRDSIAWMYGSGFPKSLDVSKAIDRAEGLLEPEGTGFTVAGFSHNPDKIQHTAPSRGYVPPEPQHESAKQWQGWGTALKPAFEPIVVARKPLCGTVAANVQQHGVGALNIDGCRVGTGTGEQPKQYVPNGKNAVYGNGMGGSEWDNSRGRWPANVLLDPHTAEELDRDSGRLHSQNPETRKGKSKVTGVTAFSPGQNNTYDDEGGASRFFPTFRYHPKANGNERPNVNGIAHPTVKPVDLIRWLIRLVTPPGGIVLDPFGGSGTTAEAAIKEHKHAILIEREPDYLPLIVCRLTKPIEVGFDFGSQQLEADEAT